MTDHPINSVVVDGSDVDKAAFRSYDKARHRLRVANVSEVTSSDYSDAYGLDLGGQLFDKDTSDTTSEHDGVTCLVDNVGTRFKLRITGVGKRIQVRAATTANITIATALNNGDTLDDVMLATSDLVLVKDQTNKSENRIIVVGETPSAPTDFDAWDDYPGALVAVSEGTANASTLWFCSANEGGTLDTTSIEFTKYAGVAGPAGATGDAGPQGEQGAQGDPGVGIILTALSPEDYAAIGSPEDGMLYLTIAGLADPENGVNLVKLADESAYDALTPNANTVYIW